jgi:hypothetical protein
MSSAPRAKTAGRDRCSRQIVSPTCLLSGQGARISSYMKRTVASRRGLRCQLLGDSAFLAALAVCCPNRQSAVVLSWPRAGAAEPSRNGSHRRPPLIGRASCRCSTGSSGAQRSGSIPTRTSGHGRGSPTFRRREPSGCVHGLLSREGKSRVEGTLRPVSPGRHAERTRTANRGTPRPPTAPQLRARPARRFSASRRRPARGARARACALACRRG